MSIETHTITDRKSARELLKRMEAWVAADTRVRLEVALPASVPAGPWDELAWMDDVPQLELILAGRPDRPAVMDGLPLALCARRVTLRDVVITGNHSGAPALQILASEAVTLERVALVGNTIRSRQRGGDPSKARKAEPMVQFGPFLDGRARGVTVRLDDVWFVGNRSHGGDMGHLLSSGVQSSRLRVGRIGVVDNDAGLDLHLEGARVESALVRDHRGTITLSSDVRTYDAADNSLPFLMELAESAAPVPGP
jgi:hypothetical protein